MGINGKNLAIGILTLCLITLIACDPAHTVTFRNDTQSVINILIPTIPKEDTPEVHTADLVDLEVGDSALLLGCHFCSIQPGEEFNYTFLLFDETHTVIVYELGRRIVVFKQQFGTKEAQKIKSPLIIVDQRRAFSTQ